MGNALSGGKNQCLKNLASEYDTVEFKDLDTLYNSIMDRNKSGQIARDDLESCLPNIPNKKILDSLFQFFDSDGDGKITILEYITGMVRFCFGTPQQKLEYVFQIFDLDRNGSISKSEMKEAIKLMGEVHPRKNAKLLEKVFKTLDSDGDNEISLEEFQGVVLKDSKLLNLFTSVINPHF